jgi:hypothetical protein
MLAGCVPVLSTRKIGELLHAMLGRPTREVDETLDVAVAALRGSGLSALPNILHGVPVQRRRAHKVRNLLDKVRKADQSSSAPFTRSRMPPTTRSALCRGLLR